MSFSSMDAVAAVSRSESVITALLCKSIIEIYDKSLDVTGNLNEHSKKDILSMSQDVHFVMFATLEAT